MAAYNKTILIGRLGCDPELHKGSNADYCKFTVCNSTLKDGVEDVQWHNIVAFGKQAKLCCDYLHKGDLVCIEGRIDRKSYEKDGETRYSITIMAEQLTFLSSAKSKHVEESQTASAKV